MSPDEDVPNRRQELPEAARCLGCGYRLRGLTSSQCPECGRGFDRSDPKTYRVLGRSKWLERMSKPPRTWSIVASAVLSLLFVLGRSGPGGPMLLIPFVSCCLFLLAPVFLAFDYLARIEALVLHRSSLLDSGDTETRRSTFRWLVLPICAVLVASTLWYNWPLVIRFRLSRTALEREVARVAAMPPQDPNHPRVSFVDGPTVVGLYPVLCERVYRDEGTGLSRIYIYTGGFFIGGWGFEYDPAQFPGRSDPLLAPGWSRYIDDK